MSDYIDKLVFKETPKEFTYEEGEPLKLNEKFKFYHNKLKFRRELNKLQYLFQDYVKTTLQAAGIRDTYLKKEYTDAFFMVIFTDPNTIKQTNAFIKEYEDITLEKGCYFIDCNSDRMLLLAKDFDAISAGTVTMETILDQVLREYFQRKEFDKFMKIRPFQLSSCKALT